MAQLNIKERSVGDVTVLDLSGKITIGEGSVQVREAVKRLLDNGKKQILLNLGDVSYVDSSGIGELVSSYTTTSNNGGELKLLNLTKKIQELLMITKLLTVFESFDDEQTALASFKSAAPGANTGGA
ncbi:MAG TPA: STAS domain-containing protein [Blastocatellia bacterium]|nr:STAS domain-containing protein [Blastocatellia bacterium]